MKAWHTQLKENVSAVGHIERDRLVSSPSIKGHLELPFPCERLMPALSI